jgi:hypothetical protein
VRTATASYKGHRFPVEIINHRVWLYFRFSLSFREVEELLLARGVVPSYETIRRLLAADASAEVDELEELDELAEGAADAGGIIQAEPDNPEDGSR